MTMRTLKTAALAACLTTAAISPAWAADPYVMRFPDQPERKAILAQQRDPATAALLSGLFPGVGHVYAGNWQRGGIIGAVGVALLVGGILFVDSMLNTPGEDPNGISPIVAGLAFGGFHLWNVRDAYYTSEAINTSLEEQARNITLPQGASF